MKSALPTTAQPALQKRRFSTDEEDSDDESAIVRPEDLVRRWGGVHVRGDSLEPVTARPLEVEPGRLHAETARGGALPSAPAHFVPTTRRQCCRG